MAIGNTPRRIHTSDDHDMIDTRTQNVYSRTLLHNLAHIVNACAMTP